VTAVACGRHVSGLVETAQLLVSEVVTNAVMHGSPPLSILVGCRGPDGLLVEVGDGSTARPQERTPSAADESGRGIALLNQLADEWGVQPLPESGKKVWFTLRESDSAVR
jgi:anti-sigma regulatory factor (Ser/Thr protein kinase)